MNCITVDIYIKYRTYTKRYDLYGPDTDSLELCIDSNHVWLNRVVYDIHNKPEEAVRYTHRIGSYIRRRLGTK